MRSSACSTVPRLGIRPVLCWSAFPLASALGSTGSAADRSALFVGFTATMAESDFPPPCIIGFGSSPSRCGPPASSGDGQTRTSRFPYKELPHMPGSLTTPARPGARDNAPVRVAFHDGYRVGVPGIVVFGAQYLACTFPCRRFAIALAGNHARLGADVDR